MKTKFIFSPRISMFPKAEVEIREKQNHRYSFSGKSDFKRDFLVGKTFKVKRIPQDCINESLFEKWIR